MIVSQNSLLNSSKVLIIIPPLIAEYLRQERPIIPHTAGDVLPVPPSRGCCVEWRGVTSEALCSYSCTDLWLYSCRNDGATCSSWVAQDQGVWESCLGQVRPLAWTWAARKHLHTSPRCCALWLPRESGHGGCGVIRNMRWMWLG